MRTKRLTRTATVGLIAVLLVGYAGAGVAVGVQDDGGTANVRVAHMSPDAPPVDILVDNETVVENLSFGNVTDYLSVPGGERNVTITAAGDQSTVVYSDNVTFDAGTNYTVVAAGEVSEGANTTFQPLVLEDNFTVPGPNEASVRLVHVAPDAVRQRLVRRGDRLRLGPTGLLRGRGARSDRERHRSGRADVQPVRRGRHGLHRLRGRVPEPAGRARRRAARGHPRHRRFGCG